MAITNAGVVVVASALIGDGGKTLFNAANAYLGVGDSSAVFSASQTDLQAAANKTRRAMDSTYPQRSSNVLTFRSTFSTGDANYTWAEHATFNASSGGDMLNRKVEALGTKTSAQSWVLTVTHTLAAA